MAQYCIECGDPLPNVWPWTIGNEGGRCAACDNATWEEDDTEIHPGPVEGCRICMIFGSKEETVYPGTWSALHQVAGETHPGVEEQS